VAFQTVSAEEGEFMSEKTNKEKEALFEDHSQALVARRDEAAVARATQEIQAALVIAQRFPRDEIRAKSRIIEACQRKELAEVAEYEYSRGGTRITGPTIDLLRAVANRWGNLRYGWSEVERRDGQSFVRCFAWDCQSNGQAERTFSVRHWRDTQGGGYALTDERDIYELLANMAARRVRACLEEVIDADVVSAAVEQCRATLKSGEKTPLADRAVKLLVPFAEFGVTQGMIELKLGNKLEAVSENQLASLRRIWKALKDGVGVREDYFRPEAAKPDFTPPAATPETTPTPSADDGDLGPQAANPAPAAPVVTPPPAAPPATKASGFNPLKALRGLLKMSGLKEGEFLDWLGATGATDGSVESLEQLAMEKGVDWMKAQTEQWPRISAAILEQKKKAKV
jgi:hypothetical protein